ncbi:radical SAM protein [Pseudothermotoga thermarum]|uniref:Radical SAM domain protein n=1 Tax=Pseudothermotoga thermarum DSM 5069 TaxID=688269 RepID=F7YUW3_9THEM|nr:radical SAM protein [Pseudothermotoga thermarum]AEH51523.1 Radical SAM domain protein [Pseudothermotoga thermarum DSM 5069]
MNEVVAVLKKRLEKCDICPVKCKVNRYFSTGRCKAGYLPILNAVVLHFGEEPPISGETGAGTIFFSGCNMRCIYCQNMYFSQLAHGVEINFEEFAEIFLDLQKNGAKTLNLVTPTPHILAIVQALEIAKSKGFNLPVVYNTSSYESVETLKMLEGYVDIYLADIKYADDETGMKYSKVPDYFTVAKKAVVEMLRQVGPFKEEKMRGLIIRHLVLPNDVSSTEKVLEFVYFGLSPNVPVSLMAQYNPLFGARNDELLNRRITKEEYEKAIERALALGLDGWVQTEEKKKVTVKPVPSTYLIIEKLKAKRTKALQKGLSQAL